MRLSWKTLAYCVIGLMVLACVSEADAQGRRAQGGGQRGGGAPGGFGQRGGGAPGAFGQRGGGPGGMGGGALGQKLMLMQRKDVQEHLELLADQIEELKTLADRDSMREAFQGMRDMSQEERQEKIQQVMRDSQRKMEDGIKRVLLPHQASRLDELVVQYSMQTRGLTSSTLAESLGLSEAEVQKLGEKARELQAKMREELQQKLVKELTPAQQAKLQQLTGKPFTFAPEERDDRGRGFAPGQRGGD